MPTPTKVQLTGGAFQDSEGNALASGYLTFQLSQDANITGVGNIVSGVEIRIDLDANGDVNVSPAQSVWGNDQMSPANAYYRVTGYTAAGQPAWGPNNQQVIGSGGTFDLGTWVPNQIVSWTPPLQPLTVETNGVPNSTQKRLNIAGSGITESGGTVTIPTGGGSGPSLQIDGTPNPNQSVLNLSDALMFGEWEARSDGTVLLAIGETQPEANTTQLSGGASVSHPNPFQIVVLTGDVTSNVLTINFAPANSGSWPLDLFAGAIIKCGQFASPFDFLNGTEITLDSVDMLTGVLTATVSHADIPSQSVTGFMGVSFVATVSYGGMVLTPPTTTTPATAPTNTGALWTDIASDFSTFVIRSTNASDNNTVNYFLLPLYF